MACTVTELFRTAQHPIVDLGPMEPGDPSYPYPRLRLSSQTAPKQFRLVRIENDFVAFSLMPELGGRIVEIVDKRTGEALMELPDPLPLATGGARGVRSNFGLRLSLDGDDRLDSMAEVDLRIEQSDEEDFASVTISNPGTWPVGFHAVFELLDDEASFVVRVTAFNRSLAYATYNGGILFDADLAPAATDGWVFQAGPHGGAWMVHSHELKTRTHHEGTVSLHRFDGNRSMSPRQSDEWSFRIAPVRVPRQFVRVGGALVVNSDSAQIQIDAHQPSPPVKILVQTRTGATLEARVTPQISELFTIRLPEQEVPLERFAVIDDARNELIAPGALVHQQLGGKSLQAGQTLPALDPTTMTGNQLEEAAFDAGSRSWAHLMLAIHACRAGEWDRADAHLDKALGFNAEDPLAWWLKARAARLQSSDADVSRELLNAHFLAPMEPLLRVEAHLAANSGESIDNPLLSHLAQFPDAMLDAVATLVFCGFTSDAMRLISECLRMTDAPMFRYFFAYCLLERGSLKVDANEQIRAAGTLQVGPPFPQRPTDRMVLSELLKTWPNDSMLEQYLALVAAT